MAQISSNKCNVCEENEGQVYCYECQHFLCETCRNWHGKFPATKRHTITSSCNVDKSIFTIKLVCENHDHEYIHYCQTCTSLICAVCATSDHKGHTFTNISDVVATNRERLNEVTCKITSKIKQITDSLLDITSVQAKQTEKEITDFTAGVQSVAEYVHNIIDSVTAIYNTRVTDFQILEQQHKAYTQAKLEKMKGEYLSVFAKLEQVQRVTHGITFFVHFKLVEKDVEGLDEIPAVEEPKKIEVFLPDDYLESVIEKLQEKFVIRSLREKEETIKKLTKEMKDTNEKYLALKKLQDDEFNKLPKARDIQTNHENIVASQQDAGVRGQSLSPFQDTIQVFVRTLAGRIVTITVNIHDTIGKLKEHVQEKTSTPSENQRMCIANMGKELSNKFTVRDYGLKNGSTLELR